MLCKFWRFSILCIICVLDYQDPEMLCKFWQFSILRIIFALDYQDPVFTLNVSLHFGYFQINVFHCSWWMNIANSSKLSWKTLYQIRQPWFCWYINLKNSRFARTKKCVKGYKKVEKVAEYITLKCLDKRHAKRKVGKVAEYISNNV